MMNTMTWKTNKVKSRFGTLNIRGLAGSVHDAELKTYGVTSILACYDIDLAALTETKHYGGSCR